MRHKNETKTNVQEAYCVHEIITTFWVDVLKRKHIGVSANVEATIVSILNRHITLLVAVLPFVVVVAVAIVVKYTIKIVWEIENKTKKKCVYE